MRQWPSRPASPTWWCASARSTSGPACASAAADAPAPRLRRSWRTTPRSDCSLPRRGSALHAAALHVDVRSDQRGLRPDCRCRPRTRGQQSRCVVLPAPDHAGRPPEFALDRRTRAATAGLLSGKRRRSRAGGDQRRTRPGPSAAAGGDHRGRPGRGLRGRDDDQLLPRGHHRAPGDGRGRRKAMA